MGKITIEQIEAIRRMRKDGFTYTKISEALGISYSTVKRYLNPKYLARQLDRKRQKWATDSEFREGYKSWRAQNFEYRCRQALISSQAKATERNHLACNATVEQLVEAFTGYCACCGIAESDYTQRLSMDHNHTTGEFRAWLCQNCNRAVDHVYKNLDSFLAYFNQFTTNGVKNVHCV